MTLNVDRSRSVLALGLLTAFGACSSDGTTDPRDNENPRITLITTLLVSGSSSVDDASGSLVGAAGEDTYSYVSAPPGSAPGVTVTITNRTRYRQSGSVIRVEASIEDGGFDPVRIAASSGDTLQVDFRAADGSLLFAGAAVVPNVRPPKIVRTNPRPGKKDVPLNARLQIVFSEPLDPATITADNIVVSAGGVVVAGTLLRTNDFIVEFVPADLLRPETSHQIVVRTAVLSLGGVALESEFSTNFETAAAPLDGHAEVVVVSGNNETGRPGDLINPRVAVRNRWGGNVAGARVTFMVAAGDGVLRPVWEGPGQWPGPGPAITNAKGEATVQWWLGRHGVNTLTVSVEIAGTVVETAIHANSVSSGYGGGEFELTSIGRAVTLYTGLYAEEAPAAPYDCIITSGSLVLSPDGWFEGKTDFDCLDVSKGLRSLAITETGFYYHSGDAIYLRYLRSNDPGGLFGDGAAIGYLGADTIAQLYRFDLQVNLAYSRR